MVWLPEHYQRPGWFTGPTPVKNTPTSNFHFFKYARSSGGFSSSASSTPVNGSDSSDEELRRIAPDHPVFRLTKS